MKAFRSFRTGGVVVWAAVLTLAAGLGPAVAMFGLFDRLLFRPLPFAEPDRLFQAHLFVNKDPRLPQAFLPVAFSMALAERAETFSGVAWVNGALVSQTSVAPGDAPLSLVGMTVNSLEVLGIHPVVGRSFAADDGVNQSQRIVLLTYEAWKSRHLASPEAIGLSWRSGSTAYKIVGVLPGGFLPPSSRLLGRIDGIFAMNNAPIGPRGEVGTAPFVRLRPGVSLDQAQAVADQVGMAPWEATDAPAANSSQRIVLQPLQSGMSILVGRSLWLMQWAVWGALVLACINAALLLYAWTLSRMRSIGIRLALGAGKMDLTRTAFVETLVVCTCGAVLAWIAYWTTSVALLAILPPTLRGFAVGAGDGRLVAAVAIAAVSAALGIAIVPAWAAAKVNVLAVMDRGRTSRVRKALNVSFVLLAIQTALAVVLAVGAAATVPTFVRLVVQSPGFSVDRLFVATVYHDVDDPTHTVPLNSSARVRGASEAISQISGVAAVGVCLASPLEGQYDSSEYWQRVGATGTVWFIDDRFFDALGVGLIAGRAFTSQEVASGANVVIVNETGATRLWPSEQPNLAVGRSDPLGRTVVGVVSDFRGHPGAEITGAVFAPITAPDALITESSLSVLVRRLDDRPLDSRVVSEALNRRFPPNSTMVRAVEQDLMPWIEEPRLLAFVLGGLGALACFLIGVAFFATSTFELARRQHEIRVRCALGASATHVRRFAIRLTGMPVLIGAAVGAASATVALRAVGTIASVTVNTATTLFAAACCVALVAGVAIVIPTVRLRRTLSGSILLSRSEQ